MERDLVTGEYAGNNNKTIHLKLTDQAEEILRESACADKLYRDRLFTGFSEEELLQVKCFFERICKNAEAELQNTEEEKIHA